MFTASVSGTHYVAAGASGYRRGTYELEVRDTPTDDTRAGAADLGDITDLDRVVFPRNVMDGEADRVDYYRFTPTETKTVKLALRQLDANADLFLEDAEGSVLHSSTATGTGNEWLAATLPSGTYYARVESQEVGRNSYVLRYGVERPDPEELQALEVAKGGGDVPVENAHGVRYVPAEAWDNHEGIYELAVVEVL